jgi:hypothetical protein
VALLSGPVSATVLLAVPVGLVLLAGSGRLWPSVAGAAALGLALGLPAGPGIAPAERGWALLAGAWLVVITGFAPRWPVFRRAFAATAAALATAAGVLAVTGGWPALWTAVERPLQRGMAAAMAMVREGGGELAARDATDAAMLRFAEGWTLVFPALLSLATLAALGLAAALLEHDGRRGVGSLREFRFDAGLVWFMIAGLAAMVLPLGVAAWRTGANVIAFMAGLYAVRGFAVVVALWAGAGPMVWVAGVVIGVLLYPLTLPATVVIGLGDTWLDLRARVRAARAKEE